MNLKSWSNLIYKYYFGRELADRVIFHISMQDLIDFAKDEDVEIAAGRKASTFDDTFIIHDFVRKFWNTSEGNKNLNDLQSKINQIANLAISEKDYVILLSIVALLIMPICENDELELHGKEYYGHLFQFLINNKFVNGKSVDTQNWNRNFLGTIHLDIIWRYIDGWAKNNNLNYKSNLVISDNGAIQYALSLMKESLLSPSKIQRFGILFDKSGLVPKANIDNSRLLSAFSNYYAQIGIPISKFKSLTAIDSRDYLVSVLRSEYDRWDGTTKVKERDRRTGRTKIESGNTCYPLLLNMEYDVLTDQLNYAIQLYCMDYDNMENLSFRTDVNNVQLPDIHIRNDGYASRPFPLSDDDCVNIFQNRQGSYGIHEVNEKTMKARFVVTDYYLLKQYKNKYISTHEFVKGEFYFALIRNEAIDDFQSWIEKNGATLISNKTLGGFYSAFRIEHAVEESQQASSLKFKNEIRCRSVNNFEIKTANDNDVVLLSKLLPAQFEISGVDISKDKIYAVSVNTQHRDSSELTYDHEKNLWILKVFTNHFQLSKEFQLYCNESPIPYGRIYKFSDFILPRTFKELSLDRWGMVSESKFSVGLKLPNDIINKNLINWNFLSQQMKLAPVEAIPPSEYLGRDLLLYAITSASYETDKWIITTEWLKSLRDRLMQEMDENEMSTQSDKYALQNALADYFRMGYVNYAYTEHGLRIVANQPTLILLTPDFERKVSPGLNGKIIVNRKCIDNRYKCLLTGGRTIEMIRDIEKQQQSLGITVEFVDSTDILMPQCVYIYAQSRNSFQQLAERCHLIYQDNLYSNALLEDLPSVDDYIERQKSNGIEQDLFLVKHFRSIDYKKMSQLYPDMASKGKCLTNAEIDKEEYDKNNDVVAFFPGTRDETCVLIDNGKMIEIDKYWGHFIGMRMQNAKVLQYDEDKELIILPQQIRLPLLYARALTLITGKTPSATFGSRAYNVVGQNPFIKACKPETILIKLGQE